MYDRANKNFIVDNRDVVDNQELSRSMRYFSTSVRTDYLRFGNPNLQRFVFGGEGKGPPNTRWPKTLGPREHKIGFLSPVLFGVRRSRVKVPTQTHILLLKKNSMETIRKSFNKFQKFSTNSFCSGSKMTRLYLKNFERPLVWWTLDPSSLKITPIGKFQRPLQ